VASGRSAATVKLKVQPHFAPQRTPLIDITVDAHASADDL